MFRPSNQAPVAQGRQRCRQLEDIGERNEHELGISERELFSVFYGHGVAGDDEGWQNIGAFSNWSFKPPELPGLFKLAEDRSSGGHSIIWFPRRPFGNSP